MEEIRAMWCEKLEQILECPVCYFCRPDGQIYQCPEGHHICHMCKIKWPNCPTCRQNWTPYRNRPLEHLCSLFDDIKESLIDPVAEINKIRNPMKVSIFTQTDQAESDTEISTAIATDLCPGQQPVIAKSSNDGHTSPYPCCVGNCAVRTSFANLIDHIKSSHSMHFVELSLDDNDFVFNHCWTFDYTEDLIFDRVFDIIDVGTFILKVSSNKCGDIIGYLTMLHCANVSKQYTYHLRISGGVDQGSQSYTGSVHSCRSPASVFHDKCLIIKNGNLQKINQQLKCTVWLNKRLEFDGSQLPKASGSNRKRKNRKKATNIAGAPKVVQEIFIP